jgi:hypothetical protein
MSPGLTEGSASTSESGPVSFGPPAGSTICGSDLGLTSVPEDLVSFAAMDYVVRMPVCHLAAGKPRPFPIGRRAEISA